MEDEKTPVALLDTLLLAERSTCRAVLWHYYTCKPVRATILLYILKDFTISNYLPDQRINELDQLFINRTVQDSIRRVNSAINNTIRHLQDNSRRRTPQDLLALFR